MPTYIIRAGLAGPVKIGKADDVEHRREALQTAHHETLHVLRVIDTHFDAEPILHERFAALRIRGEWFEFSEEMLTFIPAKPAPAAPAPINGRTIQELLADWSPREVAKRIGCTPKTVENWKKGKGGPQAKYVVAMLNDADLWKVPLLAAGKVELVTFHEAEMKNPSATPEESLSRAMAIVLSAKPANEEGQ